ncbi:coproporphyrinogen-III oxidase family protein [Sphingomonas sp. NPDC092331]|jgi:oxygen-independent coproporphyrinogen-3 oxidase|uniref:coproporphyrinogen-III oxidase family protein n=1 Tax=unclassified Sphingomonas TaxID=196159 RepID=UPI0029F273B0|nr:radical SAM protein [Pseudomonadota bacterium]
MRDEYLSLFLPQDILLESFTFPFFDINYTVDPVAMASLFHNTPDPTPGRGKRGLYVHIPFCETVCAFCPFIKSVGTLERIERYLEALHLEISMLAETPLCGSWTFDAVYLGGGTPSVLSPRQIDALLTHIRSAFRLSSDLEMTIEAEPKSATEAFCAAAAGAGANRISFGVQTLNPRYREMMNLTASFDQIQALAVRSRKLFEAANFDMIVGYPGQTEREVEEDMAAALALDVGNISVFPLDYLATLPSFLDRVRRGEYPPPPPSARRWELFHHARAELARGYDAQNMYFFSEPGMPGCRYMFDIVYGGYFDEFVGVGAGAYSMLRGLAYSNDQFERNYTQALLEERRLPIAMATPGHAYEKHYVYFGKRTRADLSEARELGIDSVIAAKLNALEGAGYVVRDRQLYTLTPAGERIYAQIMVGFLSDHQRRLYDRVCLRMKDKLNWNFDGAQSADTAAARGLAAFNVMPQRKAL